MFFVLHCNKKFPKNIFLLYFFLHETRATFIVIITCKIVPPHTHKSIGMAFKKRHCYKVNNRLFFFLRDTLIHTNNMIVHTRGQILESAYYRTLYDGSKLKYYNVIEILGKPT